MTEPGTCLVANDLLFRFPGQKRALFSIPRMELSAGSSLGISGPSGAGKTTLFHCLSGLLLPTAGSIRWNGIDLCALTEHERDLWRRRLLGLVFQEIHLVAGLSALENVLLPDRFARWKPDSELRRRAARLLEAVGIDDRPGDAALLSRGERQRVAFARALLYRPPIIMADEPTASLDADHRDDIGRMLVDLAREEDSTLIVISHDAELLGRLDRRVYLRNGELSA